MRKTYIVLSLIAASCTLFIVACKKKYISSRHGESKSHKQGLLCITCHSPNASAKQVYTVGGTVFDEVRLNAQPKAIVKLYTKAGAQGKLVATLRTDDLGNFYTNKEIDFSKGLYPTLLGTPGVKDDTKHMPKPIFIGDCNRCHGLNTESLGIN